MNKSKIVKCSKSNGKHDSSIDLYPEMFYNFHDQRCLACLGADYSDRWKQLLCMFYPEQNMILSY